MSRITSDTTRIPRMQMLDRPYGHLNVKVHAHPKLRSRRMTKAFDSNVKQSNTTQILQTNFSKQLPVL